jgi:pilus assembly protein CpaB
MTRRILAILLATVLAALGTLAVLFYVKRADDRAVSDAAAVEVLVAKQRVPAGTTGENIRKRKLVDLIRLPAGSVPKDEVLTEIPPELDKLVVTSDLQPRQLLLRGMFSQSTRSTGGLVIPSGGKVAVSFKVTSAEQVAGYVRPGSEVAVYAEYHASKDGKRMVIGEGTGDLDGAAILLPKVEVIAVGPYGEGATTTTPLETQAPTKTNQPGKDEVLVTVAVSPEDAAKLIHAAQADAIQLALLTEDSGPLQAGTGADTESAFG